MNSASTSPNCSPPSSDREPHVVLTDIRMPPTGTDEGIRAATELRERHPKVGVVVLSQYVEPTYALKLFDGGSQGRAYLLKERLSEGSQLINAIREVAAGGSVVDPEGRRDARRRPWPSRQLTARTPDATRTRGAVRDRPGQEQRRRGQSLVLSERAVEKHINSLFSKLGLSEEPTVHRRVKAVLLYLADRPTPVIRSCRLGGAVEGAVRRPEGVAGTPSMTQGDALAQPAVTSRMDGQWGRSPCFSLTTVPSSVPG